MPHHDPDPVDVLTVPGPFGSVLERLVHVAALQPDALALAGGSTLTFAELVAETERLAGRLHRELPVGEEPVGVLLPHDERLAVTLFALIRLDRLFTVLDPVAPSARLADIATRSGMRACVTSAEMGTLLAPAGRTIHLIMDDGAQPDAVPPPAVRGEDDALFLVFTSGSTGEPKGVLKPHGEQLSAAATRAETGIGIKAGDRVSLLFPMAFLGGVQVLFAALLNGASAHFFDARTARPRDVLDFAQVQRITMLGLAPHLMRAMLPAFTPGEVLTSVRQFATGGEGVSGRDVQAFREHVPADAWYVNAMGSSEASSLTSYVAGPGALLPDGTLPAGRPEQRCEIRILREDGSPAAARETGRILVVSRYLALGYWRNEALTAERFGRLPNGDRTFLSGDIGRVDADGVIHLVGRSDSAVKVRGYLVDLSEVEDALSAIDSVDEALVVSADDDSGRTRLLGYVVQRRATVPWSAADLRRVLRTTLPAYMVPGDIVTLAALPRNERGKIDRTRLPVPARIEVDARDWTQHQIVMGGIWANALGLDAVPLDGDFLALGGDSLSVEEMLAEVEARFGVPLASTDLLAAPTLREFTDLVGSGAPRSTATDLILLRAGTTGRRITCFAGAGALALQFLPIARHLTDWEVWGVQAHALERRGLVDRSVASQARRAVRDIIATQGSGPFVLAGHSYGGIVAIEAARLLRQEGHEVDLLVAIDTFVLDASATAQRSRLIEDRAARTAQRSPIDRLQRRMAGARERRTSVRTWLGRTLRAMAAGPIQFHGQAHFDAFQRRAVRDSVRHRTTQWNGRALVIGAQEDPGLRDASSRVFTGDTTWATVPGGHTALLREPLAAEVAALILDAAERAVAARGGSTPSTVL